MNNVKSSQNDGKPYRASEPVIPKRSQAKSSKAAEVHRLLHKLIKIYWFYFLPVREDGEFLRNYFRFFIYGLAVQPYVERFFLLDNYPIYLGINTLLDIGCR